MMLAILDVRTRRGRPFRLWLPMFLVWLVLAPIVLIAAPLLLIAALALRLNPIAAAAALIGLLTAFSGVRIDVDSPGAQVHIRIL